MDEEQHAQTADDEQGLSAQGLIDQYARWRRKAALLIWLALGLLALGLTVQALIAPTG